MDEWTYQRESKSMKGDSVEHSYDDGDAGGDKVVGEQVTSATGGLTTADNIIFT